MAKAAYVGVENTARKVKNVYVGVDDTARLVVKGYVGVDGVARLWFEIDGDTIVQIAAGNSHSLFLTSSGEVYSCGSNGSGRLGRVVASGSATTVNLGLIPGLSGIVQIAAGNSHSLFLTSSGEVYSCGANSDGRLGRSVAWWNETTVNLGLIPGLSGIVQIAAGNSHSLFLTSSEEVYGCGSNGSGRLGRVVASGNETTVNLGLIPGLSGIVQIAAGDTHSLFLTSSGEVYSCGNNGSGRLGRVVATGSATKVNLGLIPGLSGIVQIAAGDSHSLFLTSSEEVYSCGNNGSGQLGRVVASGSATTVNLGTVDFSLAA